MNVSGVVVSSGNIATQEIHILYTDHHGWLYSWLPAQLGDEPRALLTHIAKGLVVDHWRRQSVERAYLEAVAQLPEAEAPSPEAQALILEALTRIDTMLSLMPARTREIFLLAQVDGLTLKEIAERTQTPVITVRRHIHKALMACMAID